MAAWSWGELGTPAEAHQAFKGTQQRGGDQAGSAVRCVRTIAARDTRIATHPSNINGHGRGQPGLGAIYKK